MLLCWSWSTMIGLYGLVIAIQLIGVHSASQIFLQNDDEHLETTAAHIVNQCFASSERWSELLIVPDQDSRKILAEIHYQSKTSNTIVFLNGERDDNRLTHPGRWNIHFNTSFERSQIETTAVMIITHSVEHLEYVLSFLKNNIDKLWTPESYFLIVLDTKYDVAELNDMFKVIWDYWILNAVILSSSNKPGNRNRSDIELYSFNPYSVDHPQQWETIIHETVEVSMSPENFNHSWYIFKQTFTEIRSFDDCGDIFFDKTSNLDGYPIPISVDHYKFFSHERHESNTAREKWLTVETGLLKTISELLRFQIFEVFNNDTDKYGLRGFINGSYAGMKKDIFNGQSHLLPVSMLAMNNPGLGLTYPHDTGGACIASRIVGNKPQWTNFAVAKQIWIGLGLGLLFSAIFLYMHNKSQGIVSALLNAERLLIGSSLVNTSAWIKNRTILGSMFLVVLIIDGAIKGRFISILTVVRPYPNIETLEQLQEQEVDIYGAEAYRPMIRDPKQKARYHTNSTLESCVHAIELGERQQVCLAECRYLMYHVVNASIVHKAVTPLWMTPLAFVTARHWPMKNRYSFELQKLVESGIFQKWTSDPARDAEVEGWKHSRTSEPPAVRPTKLNDLLPAYLLLLVGLSIAVIIFAWETKGWKYLSCIKS